MSSKNKSRPKPQPSSSKASPEGRPSLRQEADRLIAKGKFKEAVKEAKLCHRAEPTPAHHRLLEQAYFGRARQLFQGGMATAAREVAQHLLDFGVTDPDLNEPAAALLVAVGLSGQAMEIQSRIDAPDVKDRLFRQAADQAVLRPDGSVGGPTEIRSGGLLVRSALEAIAKGDEAGASSALRDVPRTSPFGDWKLFTRGWSAFRRREAADTAANWDRLDPDRVPARLARALRSIDGTGEPVSPGRMEVIERWAFGEPVLGPLRALGASVAGGRWGEAFGTMAAVRHALKRIDPALSLRLTGVLYSQVLHAVPEMSYREAQGVLKGFSKAAEPLPIDPRWNRLWALAWSGPQGGVDEAEGYWKKYLDDLERVTSIRPEELGAARAVVLMFVGDLMADYAGELALPSPGHGVPGRLARVSAELGRYRRKAVESYESARGHAPTLRKAYQALMDVREEWGQVDLAAEEARRLVATFPDDFDAFVWLARHHQRREEPSPALDYVRRARALRPLDPSALKQEWITRTLLARHYAIAGDFDEARTEIAEAERLDPETSRKTHFVARKAALELKAGRADTVRTLLEAERASLADPAPLWLAMVIEARRHQASQTDLDRFDGLWADGLRTKPRAETAGALADIIGGLVAGNVAYPERDTNVREVLGYLQKTTRLKFSLRDLSDVCAFVGLQPTESPLLEKFVKKGLNLYPEAAEFPMMQADLEIAKGPSRADFADVRKNYEKAFELATKAAATDAQSGQLLARIKEGLTTLNELDGGPEPGGTLESLVAMLEASGLDPEDLLDEFGKLENLDPDELPPPPSPRARRK